jgi:hypothetical protein
VNIAGECNPVCDDFEQLHQFNNCNWKRVTNNLSKKLGLKLNCGLAQEHKKDLFNTILSAATPIAICKDSGLRRNKGQTRWID